MFGDIRSAIHAGQYQRLARYLARDLDPAMEAYIHQHLDHTRDHTHLSVVAGNPAYDSTSLFALLRQLHPYLSAQTQPPDLKVLTQINTVAIYRVLRIDQGDALFFRKVVGIVDITELVQDWLAELVIQVGHTNALSGYVNAGDALRQLFDGLLRRFNPTTSDLGRDETPWDTIDALRLDARWTKCLVQDGVTLS